EDLREGRLPCLDRAVQRPDGLVEDAAEEMRELGPALPAQGVRRLAIAEEAGVVLREAAVARERPQETMQRVRVGTGVAREHVHTPWPGGEQLREAEVGGGRQRLRHHPSAQEVPEDRLGGALAHLRAADTAWAISSTSPTISVRQPS